MYQYNDMHKSYSGYLKLEENNTNVIAFEINTLEDNKYLIKSYGTHGGGQEFFTYRLLSFENEKIKDCDSCFDGKTQFKFIRSRNDKNATVTYNNDTREIIFSEMIPKLHDGEETGFKVSTENNLKLKYNKGEFVKPNN